MKLSFVAAEVYFMSEGTPSLACMLPRIKVLHIPFTTVFTAEFENFCLVKQNNQLTIHRLSDKMCTFVHVIDVLSQKQR